MVRQEEGDSLCFPSLWVIYTTCLEPPLGVKVARPKLVGVRQEDGDSDRVPGVPPYAPCRVLGSAVLTGRGVIVFL